MNGGKREITFFMIALTLITLSPLVFAGLGDFLGKITGWAASDTASINVTIGNNAPTIAWIQNVASQTITESGNTVVYVAFNVTDVDLVASSNGLNDSTARMNFSLFGGTAYRANTTCVKTTDFNTTMRQYNCTIYLAYFDPNGTWNITVTAQDKNGATGTNTSLFFTLAESIHINLTQTSASWSALTSASQNVGSDDNPLVINNTGNANGKGVYITAYELVGVTTPSQVINASNFSAAPTAPGCDNTNLVNATSTVITGLTINRGPGAGGTEDIYLCIENISAGLSSQSYTSAQHGNWVFLAA